MTSRSLSLRRGASSGCIWRNNLQYGGLLRSYCISSRGQQTKSCLPPCGLGKVLTTTHR